MNHIVYRITCTANGKVYIGITGKSLHTRWRRHVSDALAGSRQVFHAAIRKYGAESFTPEVVTEWATRLEANRHEERLIAEHDSTNGDRGYNVDPGGTFHGTSEEVRRKIGERSRAWWANLTPDERREREEILAGVRARRDETTNAKISETLKARARAQADGTLAAFEAAQREERLANDGLGYGRSRQYKPKPPRTPEQRQESAAKCRAQQSRTMRETMQARGPEWRHERALKAAAAQSPELRSDKIRRGWAKRIPKTPEESALLLAKSWETRRANIAAACPAPVVRVNLIRHLLGS